MNHRERSLNYKHVTVKGLCLEKHGSSGIVSKQSPGETKVMASDTKSELFKYVLIHLMRFFLRHRTKLYRDLALYQNIFYPCSMGAKTNELLGLISLTGRNSGTIFQNTTASVSSKGPMILLQATKDPPEKLRKYPRGRRSN